MQVLSEQGIVAAKPGNCIFLAPEFPHYYGGSAGQWLNDWMHVAGEDAGVCAKKYGVPFNTVLTPDRTNFISPTFNEIAYEEKHQMAGWEDAVELLICRLLLLLGRELKKSTISLSPIEAGHLETLNVLRQNLPNQLEKLWTVKEMASEVGLSSSRFSALYQQFFGVSPMEDLLRLRIRHAQYLLTDQAILVSEVAHQCGFRNVNYFSALFHRRVGCAPRDYYQYTANFDQGAGPKK
jgi:AraC-like DNA-binding protein